MYEKQHPATAIPHGEGKHAEKALDEAANPLLIIPVYEHFGVGGRVEVIPGRRRFWPEPGAVVDFAIEQDPHGPVFAGHGLVPCRAQVDYAETAMPESDARFDVQTCIVRAAGPHEFPHAHDGAWVNRIAAPVGYAANTAQGNNSKTESLGEDRGTSGWRARA